MSVKEESLWPTEFEYADSELPPVTILKQQAALLGETTRNLIEGEVETRADDSGGNLHHTLYLVAPALNFYRYPLLTVEQKPTRLYPVTINLLGRDTPPFSLPATTKVYNEDMFKEALKTIFTNEETKRIVGILLAQSRGERQPA